MTLTYRTCTSCRNHKTSREFHKSNKSPDGLQGWCKQCHNMDKKTRWAANTEFINNYKINKGCIDCGFNKSPYALHFDHRDRSLKTYNISEMKHLSLKTIMKEIEKCDIRCANCHSHKTYVNQDYLAIK